MIECQKHHFTELSLLSELFLEFLKSPETLVEITKFEQYFGKLTSARSIHHFGGECSKRSKRGGGGCVGGSVCCFRCGIRSRICRLGSRICRLGSRIRGLGRSVRSGIGCFACGADNRPASPPI